MTNPLDEFTVMPNGQYMYYLPEGDDGKLIPATSRQWAEYFENRDRVIRRTYTPGWWVSSVFLGLNHQWQDDGPPLVYETMVFIGRDWADVLCWRGPSRREIEWFHESVLADYRWRMSFNWQYIKHVVARELVDVWEGWVND